MENKMIEVSLPLSRWHKVSQRIKHLQTEAQNVGLSACRPKALRLIKDRKPKFENNDELFTVAVNRFIALNKAYYDIRNAIADANNRIGITNLLAKLNQINEVSNFTKQVGTYTDITSSLTVEEIEEQQKHLDAPITEAEARFGGKDAFASVQYSPIFFDVVKFLESVHNLDAARTESFKINDQIADLNRERISVTLDEQIAKEIGVI